MDVASSSQASQRRGARVVVAIVDHPRLAKTNSTAIRAFLQEYDQYARVVKEWAQKIAVGMVFPQKLPSQFSLSSV